MWSTASERVSDALKRVCVWACVVVVQKILLAFFAFFFLQIMSVTGTLVTASSHYAVQCVLSVCACVC